MRKIESQPENNLSVLAEEVDGLQSQENDERGISCVRTIVSYLRMNDLESAKAVCLNESDKIRNYPDIVKKLEETLFENEKSPWAKIEITPAELITDEDREKIEGFKTNDAGYVDFIHVCHNLLETQTQYGSYFVGGYGGKPKLSDGLDLVNDHPGGHHGIKIKKEDIEKFVRRVRYYRETREVID